jgi:hypothetical protein
MVYDPKNAGIERYAKLINDFSRRFTTRPTPSAEDPYPCGVNQVTKKFEYWNGTSWVQPGESGTDHGLLEPGLIAFCDPQFLQAGYWGFDDDQPAFLITNRMLYTSEDIRLLVLETNGGDPYLIPQPATIMASIPLNEGMTHTMHVFYFSPIGSLWSPTGFDTNYIMTTLGVYDNDEGRWVDKMSIMINGMGPF